MRKTKLIALLLVVALVASMVVPSVSAAEDYAIKVTDGTGADAITVDAGEEILVKLNVVGNPGISGLALYLTYPEAWENTFVTNKKLFNDAAETTYTASPNLGVNPYFVNWIMPLGTTATPADRVGQKLSTENGALLEVYIQIPANTPSGTYEIGVTTAGLEGSNFAEETDASGVIVQGGEAVTVLPDTSSKLYVTVQGNEPPAAACPEHTDVNTWTSVAEGTWTGGAIADGHYKLTGNQTLTSALTVAGNICIDLNGYNITAPAAVRAFEATGALTICDSAEVDGTISGENWNVNPSADEYYYGGNILVSGEGSKLNIYGGTFIGREMKAGSYRGHVYGGNIGAIEGAELNIYGGLITGGSIIVNQQATKYHGGGNIYAATATVNISGGVISDGKVTAKYSSGSADNRKAYGVGGNIDVVSTTLNITGGLIDNGSVEVSCSATNTSATPTATAQGHGGNVYALSSTVSITGGTISNGTLSSSASTKNGGAASNEAFGGNLYLQNTPTTIGGTAQIIDGEVIDNLTSARGGNIYLNSTSTLTVEGHAVISGGKCHTDNARGGNIFTAGPVTINGGTIANGAAGWGSNMMLQAGGSITMNGGEVLGGTGSYSVLVQRGTFTMNGGSIEDTTDGKAALSAQGTENTNGGKVYLNAGVVGSIHANRSSTIEVNGATIGEANLYHTAAVTVKAGTITKIWKIGENATPTVTLNEGVICQGFNPALNNVEGFEAYLMDKSTGKTNYTLYSKLATALAAAQAGNTVTLMADVTADAVAVPAGVTLNLYGRTLTATSVTATFEGAQIKDSKMGVSGAGKIISNSVAVNAENAFLPVAANGVYTFEEIAFAQSLVEENNKATYKFYVKSEAASTLIDDAILAGEAVSLDVKVTWTNGLGETKEKTFTLSAELMAQLAADWDNKMIILTINDLTNVSNLTCTAQITSGNVTVTA